MTEEDIVKQLVAEGKTLADVRVTLISNGYGTENALELFTRAGGVAPTQTQEPKTFLDTQIDGVSKIPDKSSLQESINKSFSFKKDMIVLWEQKGVIFLATFLLSLSALLALYAPKLAGPTVIPELFVGLQFFCMVIATFITVWGMGVLLVGIVKHEDNYGAFFSFQWSLQKTFPLLLLLILRMLLVGVGFFFLIIPGLVLYFFTMLSSVVFVRENIGGLQAMVRSTDLLSGNYKSSMTSGVFRLLVLVPFFLVLLVLVSLPHFFVPQLKIISTLLSVFVFVLFNAFCLLVLKQTYQLRLPKHAFFDMYAQKKVKWLYSFFLFLGLLFLSLISYHVFQNADQYFASFKGSYAESIKNTSSVADDDVAVDSFGDVLTVRQVNSLATPANIYKNRLISYDGLCKSIGIPEGISCEENGEGFVIQARLSTGKIQCIDNFNFSGEIDVPGSLPQGCQ